PSAITAIVRVASTVSRVPTSRFQAAAGKRPAIRYALQTHIRAALVQLQLGAACNALHPVKARMGRWMLHLSDHIEDDMLPLTQEVLSQILGVRRTTVTLLMRSLRDSGAIRSERRGQIEIDRSRLGAVACECHAPMPREIDEVFSKKPALSGTAAEPDELAYPPEACSGKRAAAFKLRSGILMRIEVRRGVGLRLEPGNLAQHLGDFPQFVARGPGPQLSCFV